jgi:hypothetical protein
MTPLTGAVDALFEGWNRSDSPGCALAVIQDGESVHRRGYGMAEVERNVPNVSIRHALGFYYEDELFDLICRQKALDFKPGDEFL